MQTRSGAEIEMGRVRLPVSGRMVALRPPSGEEDLMLAEAARTERADAAMAVALADRLSRAVDGEPLDWGTLSVADLDVLVLRLRQAQIGDRVRADVECPAANCGKRIDIDFSIEEFLTHKAPRAARSRDRGWTLLPDEEPGWFRLAMSIEGSHEPAFEGANARQVRFRLPTAADLLVVAGQPAADKELAMRCLRPPDVSARLRRRAEAVMEAMAPSFSSDLQGVCPECGSSFTFQFDARWFCLRELRDRAAFVYLDVDLLARRYHWSETEILAMPQVRRSAYVELARQDGGA